MTKQPISARNMWVEFGKLYFAATNHSRAEFRYTEFYTKNAVWFAALNTWNNYALKDELRARLAEIRAMAVMSKCPDLVSDVDNLSLFLSVADRRAHEAEKELEVRGPGQPRKYQTKAEYRKARSEQYYAKKKAKQQEQPEPTETPSDSRHTSETGSST